MQIEISESRCAGCQNCTPYYRKRHDGQYIAVDCAYCNVLRRTTKPSNRCRHYQERGNVVGIYGFKVIEENAQTNSVRILKER